MDKIDLDGFLDPTPIEFIEAPEDAAFAKSEREREQRRKDGVPSPGPWTYEDTYDACCGKACTPDGCHESHRAGLYHIVGPDWYDYDVVYPDVVCNEADARLIAAAPDLLAAARSALREMINTVAPRDSFTDAVDALDAAISKAER